MEEFNGIAFVRDDSQSILDVLKSQLKRQEEQVNNTKAAIASLENNPQVLTVLVALAKAGKSLR